MKKRLAMVGALCIFAALPAVALIGQGTEAPQDCFDSLTAGSPDCRSLNSMRPNERLKDAESSASAMPSEDPRAVYAGARPQTPKPPDPPTEFQKFVTATTGETLAIYGANLFRNVPSTFSPNLMSPVSGDYVLGPEDEVRVRIWGSLVYSGNLQVDRSGNIYVPQAGTVHVAGMKQAELEAHLRSAIARNYRNFDLSVDLGRIRSIQIYVTGQARQPGVYTVSSLSTLVDALFASGGPSPQGTMRHIQLNREGKTIADFDLYSLLMRGDKSHDVRLQSEDVLFIPPVGSEVAITGSVHAAAIYELRAEDTINDLIEDAGKTTAVSAHARISLERIEPQHGRQAMEFAFDAAGLSTRLADGDIVRVFPIVPSYEKTVILRGNIANPGRYAWHPGMRLSDLIPDRDSLQSRDYWWSRSRLGLPALEFEPLPASTLPGAPQVGTSGMTGNAGGAENPSSAANVPGTGGSASNLSNGGNNASIAESYLQNASDQPVKNELRLSASDINWGYAVIERLDSESLKTSLIPFDLGGLVLRHDASQDKELQPNDAVTILSQADIHVPIDEQTRYVKLEGEIVHAGVYSVVPGETLRDLVARAGGFTQNAYLYGSQFTRESTRALQQARIDEYVRNLDVEIERDTLALSSNPGTSTSSAASVTASRSAAQDLIALLGKIRATGRVVLQVHPGQVKIDDVPTVRLEDKDRFIVPSVPSVVNVVGAVYNQNTFLYEPAASTGSYLRLAGGPSRNADYGHAFVIRADGSVVSRKDTKGLWGDNFDHLRLNPGDTVVVPEKTLRNALLRGFLDWTQILSQLTLGAAAINVLK